MVRADEETRAALYRANWNARIVAEQARERALKGDAAARKALQTNWDPVILARLEARAAGGQEENRE